MQYLHRHAALTILLPLVLLAGESARADESTLLTHTRQLTFEGRRAGEGYFSADGRLLVFQSERHEGNPFYQIYLMDLETGDTTLISPGHGKTTCAWIHPSSTRILFASTHEDPDAKKKQEEELELRASGQQRRYEWSFDEHFELYEKDLATGALTRLTDANGYDAEGSYSPDGSLIAFASNRHTYDRALTDDEKKQLEHDPSYFMDLYLMNADGSNLRRLTDAPGYDGGPFFSPDGKRLCFRRFSPDGATAEIYTIAIDGRDERRLTHLGHMSWAPYYHPSGEYLIFTTNVHGFANFELYLVDAQGRKDPVRVTHTEGFDGLPVFSPDGNRLAWTSNRAPGNQSQIFIADWNHAKAREMLGLADAPAIAIPETAADITAADLEKHVRILAGEAMQGRMTGEAGERLATQYAADAFRALGLVPAGDNGTYFQQFDFTAGVSLGPDNALTATFPDDKTARYKPDHDWRPLSFSATGQIPAAPVVFAGYGIVAPAEGDFEEYDAYVHLDVTDKWVMILRYLPENIAPERRQHLHRYASLRHKAMTARDRGARGLIVVSGPNSQVKEQLIPMRLDGSLAGSGLAALSITDELAEVFLNLHDKSLKSLQDKLDTGEPMMGFSLDKVSLNASIDIEKETRTGRNVLARLPAGDKPTEHIVILGAHIDHLGQGRSAGSTARDEESEDIHYGADDNASGVAALFEVAQHLSASRDRKGAQKPSEASRDHQGAENSGLKHDILFAAWSGEELGLLGSAHFVNHLAEGDPARTLHPHIMAYINMDMVGRLRENLIVQGVGSSSIWPAVIEQRNAPVGLPITLQNDSYLPTDATSFYLRGVPILSLFTGSHAEYHSPRDTPDTLNYDGLARVAKLAALITRDLALRDKAPDYQAQARPDSGAQRARLRAYLGTIPDYAAEDIEGLKLSGVVKSGPAEQAGLRAGDIILELAGRKITNIYDYTYAIEALKINEPVSITIEREGNSLELTLTPGSRE